MYGRLQKAVDRLNNVVQEDLTAIRAACARLTGVTKIIIAHRLSTVRNANAISVLEHGQVVERGSHDDLEQKGEYYQLYHGMFELS